MGGLINQDVARRKTRNHEMIPYAELSTGMLAGGVKRGGAPVLCDLTVVGCGECVKMG